MRTIFVCLFSNVVLGNFTRPKSVLEKLKIRAEKDQDLRLVYLTSEVYREIVKPYLDKNVLVEYIKKDEPRGRLYKLFHFFYSYLIFTDTTRILATFGARADIPPAGGNRHLAFLKSFIANTFGRSKFIRTRLVPWIFSRKYASRSYGPLFDKYRPDLIFLPNIAFSPDQDLIAEAKRRGIKTVGMACNWDHLNKYFIPLRVDFLIVQNEPMLREAVELQSYEPGRAFPTGFPQFDLYAFAKEYVFPREEFFKKAGIPQGNKLIVFISGAAYSLDEPDILAEISGWIKSGKLGFKATLLIRPYVVLRDRAREEEKYKELLSDPNVVFNWEKSGESLENLRYYLSMFYYADVIISIFSTTAIEAAIFDKPILTIGFDGYKKRPYHESIRRLEDMSHFKNVLETGSVKVVRSFRDLYENLKTYLENPGLDWEKRKELVQKMCYKMDGLASERIVDFVLAKLRG